MPKARSAVYNCKLTIQLVACRVCNVLYFCVQWNQKSKEEWPMITVAFAALFLLGCPVACVYFDRVFGDLGEVTRRRSSVARPLSELKEKYVNK